jgi:hypothetical protein
MDQETYQATAPIARMMGELARRNLPAEKAKARQEQQKIARQLRREGSSYIPGIGQKSMRIDARTYHRWHREHPGCWNDTTFQREMARDNPHLCAPGFRPAKTYRATWSKSYG